ncbi:MAG: RluA family pseudouridine synthase [Chitinophagales bacterium]
MQLEILNETKEWIAVNKPSGLLVEENPYEISVEAILKEQHKYIGIVHRLDRVTSGILILAKKKSALKILNKQFSDKIVEKTYQAWVSSKPSKNKDSLEHYLQKDQLNKCAIISETARRNNSLVKLDYEVLKSEEDRFLLKLTPKTGKFHQIRAQLAYIGCPIIDDTKYNASKSTTHLKHIALRASSLFFLDPVSEKRVSVSIDEEFRYKF